MISDRPGFRAGLRWGFLAGLTAGLTTCGMLWAPPARAQATEDAPFAVATSATGATVTLYTGRGVCVGEARAAIWRPAPGSDAAPVPGCWILTGGQVLVSFLDGERGDIPVGALVKARSL